MAEPERGPLGLGGTAFRGRLVMGKDEMVLMQWERGRFSGAPLGSPTCSEGILGCEFGMEPVCLVERLWFFPAQACR